MSRNYGLPVKPPGNLVVCTECGRVLTAPKTIARRMCRSCWRVHRLLGGAVP
jgi:hypothetical protein